MKGMLVWKSEIKLKFNFKFGAGSSVFGRARPSLVKDGRANLGRFQLRPRTNILIHPLLGLDDEHDSLVHHSIRSPSHGRPLMDDGTYLLCLLHHHKSLHVCFAKRASLNKDNSLKPIPPSAFGSHISSHFTQCIFLLSPL